MVVEPSSVRPSLLNNFTGYNREEQISAVLEASPGCHYWLPVYADF